MYDVDKNKLKYLFNTQRLTTYEEVREFAPDMVINAVSLQYTVQVFEEIIPYLPEDSILDLRVHIAV